MKITVLTGSPRANSNSGYLAGEFVRGAESAGHSVFRFDAGRANIAPCRACNACRMDGPCVQRDDFWLVRDHLLESEAICLCTPMYYFGFSAQLKILIDRFYSINGKLATPRKAVLIATYADNSPREEAPMLLHFDVLLQYLNWQDAGRLMCQGLWPAGAVQGTKWPEKAFALGKNI